MKRNKSVRIQMAWLTALSVLFGSTSVSASTIQQLLEAASRHPNIEVSELSVRQAISREEQATATLYPKINLFGRAEIYNSPTNLRPMPPTEVNVTAGDSLPFSREILRYGFSLEAPLYAAKIYRLREKLRILAGKSVLANQINLVSRQATVISLNSGYQALVQLREAVDGRLASLDATRDTVRLKVENGRTPGSELMKIDNLKIILEQQQTVITQKALDLERDFLNITGLEIAAPAAMELANAPAGDELIGIKVAEAELAGQKKEVAQARAGRYPTLSLYGTISEIDGEAYNTDEHISRSYNFAGLVMTVPLFDRSLGADERLARLGEKAAEKKLAEIRMELRALEKSLQARLPVAAMSLTLAEKAHANNTQLLDITRISYDSGRTTTEEYLRYEAQLLDSQAGIAKARDEQWQIHAKLAVLYGIDLRGVVK